MLGEVPLGAGATSSSVVTHGAQKSDRGNGVGYITSLSRWPLQALKRVQAEGTAEHSVWFGKGVGKSTCQRQPKRIMYALRAAEILYFKIKWRQGQCMFWEEHTCTPGLKMSVQLHMHSCYNWPCQSGVGAQEHLVSWVFTLTAQLLIKSASETETWLAKVAFRVEIGKMLTQRC